jgi:hypothetical protein
MLPGASGSLSRVAIVSLMLAAGVGVSTAARAEAPSPARTVVVLVDAQVLPLARRLEQEIESLGLSVQAVSADDPRAAELANAAQAAGAVAVIHVAPKGGGDVEMTVLDGATGKTVTWKLVAPTSVEPAASELMATRTVELLRASLLELAARRAQRAEPLQPASTKAAPKGASPEYEGGQALALSLGPAALYSATFRPGAELLASVTWMPSRALGLSGAVLAPIAPPRLSSPQGSVDLFASLYRLGAVLQVGGNASAVSLRGTAGVELDKLRFEGHATSPYLGATDNRTTWSPFLGVAPRFRLTPSIHVVTELVLALASPSTIVRVAGQEVTSFGRPFGTAALALELTLPLGGS